MVAACAETDAPNISAVTIGRIHLGVMGGSLLEASRDLFGMLFVALENLQAGLQQALQFRVVRAGNKRRLKRAIDRLVIVDFFADIGLLKFGALQRAELGKLAGG